MAGPVYLLVTLFSTFFSLCLSSCGPYGHDISSLVKPGYWWFQTDLAQCGPFPILSGSLNSSACNFFFSVCSPVPVFCRADTAACSFAGELMSNPIQISSWPRNFGAQSTYDFKVIDNEEFKASYVDGETCSNDRRKKWETIITFQCNTTAKWDLKRNKSLKFDGAVAPRPTKFLIEDCKLQITFQASFACGPVPPGTGSQSLSIGSLLLILFFPSFFLYCVVGVLVNSHAGRRGKEMVPHSKFWFELPDLIMDGFLFIMNCLTCRDACARDPNRLYESI